MIGKRSRVTIAPSAVGHVGVAVRALVASGWTPAKAPAEGRLVRNRQLITLDSPGRRISLRLFVYKVTGSGRQREHERRVEITSTYWSGLEAEPGFTDVVLGYDPDADVFVGLDPVRLRHGGETSNASSFLEPSGLNRSKSAPFVVLLRQTKIFPEGEYQAFFRPERVGEYLQNFLAIHTGGYEVSGISDKTTLATDWKDRAIGKVETSAASGRVLILERDTEGPVRAVRLTNRALKLLDQPKHYLPSRKITPEELRAIHERQEENGFLGEQFVFDSEKQDLMKAGRTTLARRVDWVSRRSIGEGYDIASFEPKTGEPRYIEVKTTESTVRVFATSLHEWARARELGAQYYIYRVTNVRHLPVVQKLRDPVQLEQRGKLKLSAAGWQIQILN